MPTPFPAYCPPLFQPQSEICHFSHQAASPLSFHPLGGLPPITWAETLMPGLPEAVAGWRGGKCRLPAECTELSVGKHPPPAWVSPSCRSWCSVLLWSGSGWTCGDLRAETKSFRAKEPLGARFFSGQGWPDPPISKSENARVWKIKAMQAEKITLSLNSFIYPLPLSCSLMTK